MAPAQSSQVQVRMYSQGVGDCFLLSFPRAPTGNPVADARPVYVLIDCGVISGTPNSTERMRRVVVDIRETTADPDLPPGADGKAKGHLDLLVITHEHWDHLSGFIYKDAQEQWKQIEVDQVWMGWTADHERDGLGQVLQEIKDLQRQALTAIAAQGLRFGVAERLGAVDAPRLGVDERVRTASSLTRFLMDEDDAPDRSLAGGLEFVKKKLARNKPVYCKPGEVRPVPGSDAVAYVLGPPRRWKLLSKMDPSSDNPETYENPFAMDTKSEEEGDEKELEGEDLVDALRRMLDRPSALTAFVAALDSHAMTDPDAPTETTAGKPPGELYYRSFPFDRAFRIPLAVAEAAAVNGPGTYPVLDAYFNPINQWRRVDTEYLMAAEAFALAADNFVNNTSLVLAFELPPATDGGERKVLLFVADAQVGNWLSWDEISSWTVHDGAKPSQPAAADVNDLFARTVFYKVGHHGSHNATLKQKGVERMGKEGNLTAFVPVSVPVATNVGWTEMPLTTMLDALSKRSGHRVVLPHGKAWSPAAGESDEEARHRIGVEISPQTLPVKTTEEDGVVTQIEEEVPLWVQIAVTP